MHASSLENMKWCRDHFVREEEFAGGRRLSVLDIGGADYNGSYRRLFPQDCFDYRTADIGNEREVDLHMPSPYEIPLADESVDIVVSGQMLEHAEFFWLIFTEMSRVMRMSGRLFLIAPSAGPIHRYPVDCYRFYPDAYHALARYAGLHVAEVYHDRRGPWNDLVGVFARSEPSRNAEVPQRFIDVAEPQVEYRDTEETRAQLGDADYLDLMKRLHTALEPKRYLEIGVRHGRSLDLADCPAVAVDPCPAAGFEPGPNVEYFRQTSDDFFRSGNLTVLGDGPDLVFIDGMHHFEFALRDFMNTEAIAHPGTAIVIDDVLPAHPRQADRQRNTRLWAGDVWKLQRCLTQARPDLILLPIDTRPTGSLLVLGVDPKNDTLWQRYNPLVRRFTEGSDSVPEDILQRHGAFATPSTAALGELASLLRQRRDGSLNPPGFRRNVLDTVANWPRAARP